MMKKYKLTLEQVNSQVTNVHLIAEHIVKWRQVAPRLRLTKPDIEAIEVNGRNEEERRKEMLDKWIQKNGSGATYQCLLKMCVEAHDKELAENICKELERQGMHCRLIRDVSIINCVSLVPLNALLCLEQLVN